MLIYSPIGSIYYLIHYSNLISYHSENICHSGKFSNEFVGPLRTSWTFIDVRGSQVAPDGSGKLKKKSGFTTEYNITHTIPDDYSDIGTQECSSVLTKDGRTIGTVPAADGDTGHW